MGMSGWWSWLHEDIENLKLLRAMTKDEEQQKILNKVIARLENKTKEA